MCENGGRPAKLSALAVSIVRTPAYRVWLQGAVAVGLLGLVDAGYSGDWSRIGAISKETELQIQQAVQVIAAFHLACAAAGWYECSRRGEKKARLARTAKVAAVGLLALVEIVLLPEGEA